MQNPSDTLSQHPGGNTTSFWQATTERPTFPTLEADINVDVAIVGAGLAGITTAYLLTKAGVKVAVFDDGPVGGGETSRTTAHITNVIDDRYATLESKHGEKDSRLVMESQTVAIDLIEKIVREEHIDCDFKRLDGYLIRGATWKTGDFQKEFEACQRAGFTDIEMLDRFPNEQLSASDCIRFPGQATFHPLKYLYALARIVVDRGGSIYEGAHAQGFKAIRNNGDKNVPVEITTERGHRIIARTAAIATNTPVNDRVVIHTKQAAYRTYVVGLEIQKGQFPDVLIWDTEDPYHYVRVAETDDSSKQMLILGGEDHKTGQKDSDDREASYARFTALQKWAMEHIKCQWIPRFQWSGQVMEPMDGLPFIGRNPMDESNTYIITGDSGMGMTNTTVGAMIVSDLILGRENPFAELYDPSRKSLSAAGEFLKENLNVAAQYADLIVDGDASGTSQIPNGGGLIIKKGLNHYAVYRDESGLFHEFSAKCPHLGCSVNWNSVEKTWDCPCHGSRFDALGTVINGPALANLERTTVTLPVS